MQRRGRSRQVSHAALARKASEERARQRRALLEKLTTTTALLVEEMGSSATFEQPSLEAAVEGYPSPFLRLPPEVAGSSSNSKLHYSPVRHSNIIGEHSHLPSFYVSYDHNLTCDVALLDLTGPEFEFSSQFELHFQELDLSSPMLNSEIYTYPPSVPPSPITSAAVTPDTSESQTSDSYFSLSSLEERSSPTPLTLLDQLHTAYALDDLPLAKILLLKITQDVQDITSRTDPRLDAVKPEDFDVAFLPKGGLMTPEDEARLFARQEKEQKRLKKEAHEAQEEANRYREKVERERREQEEKDRVEKEERERVERERAWEGWVEGVWESAKKEMEEMKEIRELARRCQEDVERACQEQRRQDRRRRANADSRRTHTAKGSVSTPLPRISYAHLPTTRLDSLPPSQTELLYTLPNIPKHSAQRRRLIRTKDGSSCSTACNPSHPLSLRKTIVPSSSPFLALESLSETSTASSSFDLDASQKYPSTVSVQEVLAAMRGELFPPEFLPPEKRDSSQHTLHGRTKSDDFDLGGLRQRSKTPHHGLKANSTSSSSSALTRRQRRNEALLSELLSSSNDQLEVDRLCNRRKGKASDDIRMKRMTPLRMNSSASVTSAMSAKSMCAACSENLMSPSAMSSSSGISRSGSWLSFMSSSSVSSASTVLTTPSASTSGSSPPNKPLVRTGSVFSTWLKGVASQSSPTPADQCTCEHLGVSRTYTAFRGIECRLIPVGKDESPLPLDLLDETVSPSSTLINTKSSAAIAQSDMAFGKSTHAMASPTGSKSLLRSVTNFLDVAKSFQSAYMHAAMFAALATVPNVSLYGSDWDREYEHKPGRKQSNAVGEHGGSEARRRLQPVGCRVGTNEVSFFTSAIKKSSQQSIDADAAQPVTGEYIPMVPRKLYNGEHPPRTVLPNPLPFPIHFKPQRSLTGSPIRRWSFELLQTQARSPFKRRPVSPLRYGPNGFRRSSRRSTSPPFSTTQPVLRTRFVGNPVYLRLKALQNCTGIPVVDSQILELHEEGVLIKGGILGSGKEKVLGTAFEDVGRSRLGVDLLHEPTLQHRVTLPINSPIPWWHPRNDIDNVQLRWEDGSVRRGRSVVKG
ncbi:hypothetical protein F5876DRAFT_61982 [Lentinula aff. lateritia]|uniref:Uncharacterized protein n=1 Tax=Lentinula aff. lateritia TaxID=2804960 RepID=A0ACC1UD82_9AGAR|nr:hypothetical protein F5876DRAFT_61982 [Lentinula aff. lateritia]